MGMNKRNRLAFAGLIMLAGTLSACGNSESPTVWNDYSDVGPWHLIRYSSEGSPEKAMACSAVTENIQGSSLRVLRTKDGYSVSVNGASPSEGTETIKMFVYLDANSEDKQEFDGSFTEETAYEYDHWLGKSLSSDDPLLTGIRQSETLTASIYSPGNRTGNDWPESHFELYDASSVLGALDACMGPSSIAPASVPPSNAEGPCPDGASLPNTGMCLSTARYLLHTPKGGSDELAPDCHWTVTDARLSENEFLLFKAMSCGDSTTSLTAGATGFPTSLTVKVAPTAAYTEGFGFDAADSWSDPVVTVFKYDENLSYLDEVPRIAREAAMAAGMPYSEACTLEYDEFSGLQAINDHNEPDFDSDYWVSPCGPLGAQEGYTVLWSYLRSGYVAAMHYPMDGFFGIDWNSIALVTQDENGNWVTQ